MSSSSISTTTQVKEEFEAARKGALKRLGFTPSQSQFILHLIHNWNPCDSTTNPPQS